MIQVKYKSGWESGLCSCVSVEFFPQIGKVKLVFVGGIERRNCFVETLERTLCAASTPPQRRGHTRDLNALKKGVSRPRTGFGGCRKREDLRLSSEVVRWLHRVTHSKSTEG